MNSGRLRILVPRLVDAENRNAQNLNAKALLARFREDGARWVTAYVDSEPDPAVRRSRCVGLVRLSPARLWTWRLAMFYQKRADAIFYPGVEWMDDAGLRISALRGRVPIVGTYEGVAGDAEREAALGAAAGHPVFCDRVDRKRLARVDRILNRADHIIAISPFLAKLGSRIFGERFSVLPLGVETKVFNPLGRSRPVRPRVVGAGRLSVRKRVASFLDLAARHSEADFVWYGEGPLRDGLIRSAHERKLRNVVFPGSASRHDLAAAFRRASVFVLPSHSEGAPKVTQEAASCGLPVVLFGFYESPSVVNGENGYVVWSDGELCDRLGELIADPAKAEAMGRRGAEMAKDWDWDVIAPRWERRVMELVRSHE